MGGTPSRDDAPSSSILLQDANYQQQNCQRSILEACDRPSSIARRQTALSEQRPNLLAKPGEKITILGSRKTGLQSPRHSSPLCHENIPSPTTTLKLAPSGESKNVPKLAGPVKEGLPPSKRIYCYRQTERCFAGSTSVEVRQNRLILGPSADLDYIGRPLADK